MKRVEFSETKKAEGKPLHGLNFMITDHIERALKDPPDLRQGNKMVVHMK